MSTKSSSKFSRNMLTLLFSVAFSMTVFAASPPSQVTGVEAKLVNDTTVDLSWNEATSEEGIIVNYKVYYGKNSVGEMGESYNNEVDTENQTTFYSVENLESGNTYYFAVTALDDELNQSSNYSDEVFIELPAVEMEELAIEEPEEVIIEEEPEKPAAPIDIAPPAEVKKFTVDKSTLKNSNAVSLRWQKSANSDGDVLDQIFYVKKGKGNWDNGYSIGKDLEEMVFDVEKDTNYEVKIITTDTAGNRSNGTILVFSTETLVTSGPGIFITLGIVAIIMFLFLSLRRRS